VFAASQFNSLKDLYDSHQKPDYIAKDLTAISKSFSEITQIHSTS